MQDRSTRQSNAIQMMVSLNRTEVAAFDFLLLMNTLELNNKGQVALEAEAVYLMLNLSKSCHRVAWANATYFFRPSFRSPAFLQAKLWPTEVKAVILFV